MKFLIVENSSKNRKPIKDALKLEFENCEILEANNERNGMKKLSKNIINLIISDDRYFLYKINSNSILAKKPLLFLTEEKEEDLKRGFPEMKKVIFMNKLLPIENIIKNVKELLEK